VVDTHGLVLYALERWKKLGKAGRRVLSAADEGEAVVHVPTIVIVEIGELERLGRLRLRNGMTTWTRGLFSREAFRPAELNVEIALEAHSLHGIQERGDRLIAATALHLDLPLITRVHALGRATGVRTIW
jgi:PIN domain nuclease of toxin-antitoxin system